MGQQTQSTARNKHILKVSHTLSHTCPIPQKQGYGTLFSAFHNKKPTM